MYNSDSGSLYVMLYSQYITVDLPPVTVRCCHSIIDYIPSAVPFIPVMHLFHSWRPVFPTACHLFWSSLSPPTLWQTLVLHISMSDTAFCLLVYSFVLFFRFHIHEWNQRVFLLGKFKRNFLKVWGKKANQGQVPGLSYLFFV